MFLPTLENSFYYLYARRQSAPPSFYDIMMKPWRPFSFGLWLFMLAVVLSVTLAHFVVYALETRENVFSVRSLSVLAEELYLAVAGAMAGQFHEPTSIASRCTIHPFEIRSRLDLMRYVLDQGGFQVSLWGFISLSSLLSLHVCSRSRAGRRLQHPTSPRRLLNAQIQQIWHRYSSPTPQISP
jgi:hypothetical protein